MLTRKEASNLHEKSVAKKFQNVGGKIVPSSGSGKFDGGDVSIGDDKDILIECKTVVSCKASFSIKKDWLSKIEEQRFEQGYKNCCLSFRFEPYGKNYYVVNEEFFKELVNCYMEVQNNGK